MEPLGRDRASILDLFEELCNHTQAHPHFDVSYPPLDNPEDSEAESDQGDRSQEQAVVALDCEMVYSEEDPMDLVRVSIVALPHKYHDMNLADLAEYGANMDSGSGSSSSTTTTSTSKSRNGRKSSISKSRGTAIGSSTGAGAKPGRKFKGKKEEEEEEDGDAPDILLELIVRPASRVIDWRTHISGVDEAMV